MHIAPPARAATHQKRREIQGLRALAVGLVIANHVFGHPRGGFLGVDVFFVISGYLITGLLLREQGKTARISITGFYARRARRILPLALLVLAVTTVVARLQFSATRAHDSGVDALWSLAFGANVHLAKVGTDYFQQNRPESPLQHFWSLSVEEQFYLAWPAVLMASFALLHGRRRTLVIATLSALSFAWCVHSTAVSPTSAYFSTPARAWELGAGAVLASAVHGLTRLTARARGLAGWAGALLLLVSVLTIGTQGFPGYRALPPVAAAALLLVSGDGPAPRWGVGRLLTLTPLVYLGDLSYSLYLWHWPALVLGRSALGDGLGVHLVLLGVTLLLAAASFHFIERPVLASRWLLHLPGAHPSKQGIAWATALVVIAAGSITLATPTAPSTAQTVRSAQATKQKVLNAAQLTAALVAALNAQQWPPLIPDLSAVRTDKAPEFRLGCFDPPSVASTRCRFALPGPTKTALVIGDSIAVSWLPGLRAALEPQGFRLHAIAFKNCPAANVQIVVPRAEHTSEVCNRLHGSLADEVQAEHPDLVILSDQARAIEQLADGSTGSEAENEWSEGMRKQITAMKSPGARFVILAPNPEGPDPALCYQAGSSPSDCVGTPDGAWHSKQRAEQAAAQATGATYVDTSSWFCDTTPRCPVFASETSMRWDRIHLTASYSRLLASLLARAVKADA
jgi:peptidoglycan/LPS O-acetylase OafA/YrhL